MNSYDALRNAHMDAEREYVEQGADEARANAPITRYPRAIPGPYTLIGEPNGYSIVAPSQDRGDVIARIRGGAFVSVATEEATGRLLAATPDLLAACREAEGVLTEPGIMDVDEWKAWCKRTVCDIRAAIAKAKGVHDDDG